MMNKLQIRGRLRLLSSFLFGWLYIPHIMIYACKRNVRSIVNSDLGRLDEDTGFNLCNATRFLYHLHNDRYFRTLFYHRIGPVLTLLMGWWRPGDRYFVISKTTEIGEGAYFAHSFSTEINAKSIGRNFSCRHLTTLGNKKDGDNDNRPTIGDNVTLGVNVTIIGPVHIGNNVTIGAGSVVVKDLPDNCVAVGNPARVIKYIE